MIPDVAMTQTSIVSPAEAGSSGKGKTVILAVLAAVVVAFFYFDLGRYLSLDALKANRDALLAFTDRHYVASVSIFVLGYCALVAVSLPGAIFFTLAGGFLFGSVIGTLYINLGATSGATLAFLVSRYLLRNIVEQKFGKWVAPLQDGFGKNAFSYLMTLRLIPLFPFFVVNLVCGLTRVPLATFVGATALGIIPGSFVFAYAGRQLGTINSVKEIASPNVLMAFTLLGLLALAPILYQKYSAKKSAAQ